MAHPRRVLVEPSTAATAAATATIDFVGGLGLLVAQNTLQKRINRRVLAETKGRGGGGVRGRVVLDVVGADNKWVIDNFNQQAALELLK